MNNFQSEMKEKKRKVSRVEISKDSKYIFWFNNFKIRLGYDLECFKDSSKTFASKVHSVKNFNY